MHTAAATPWLGASARRRRIGVILALAAAAVLTSAFGSAQAQAVAPAWDVQVSSEPTNFPPGDPNGLALGNMPLYRVQVTNVGAGQTSGPITLTDTLPGGLAPIEVQPGNGPRINVATNTPGTDSCTFSGQEITCSVTNTFRAGESFTALIPVAVASLPEGTALENAVTISGGGAPAVQGATTTTISSDAAPFDFKQGAGGLAASLTDANGEPVTQAGAHPYALTVDMGINSERLGPGILNGADGGARDVVAELPPGLVVNPNASLVRCSESDLETDSCPLASQVGRVSVTTFATGLLTNEAALYNLEPPPGSPAMFGFNAFGIGLYVHIAGGVRNGDYALTATSNDILARNGNPFLGIQVQLWGDPSHPSHDDARGACAITGGCDEGPRSITHLDTPLLTMPTRCTDSLELRARADSWQHPGVFVDRDSEVTDSNGNPVGVTGCDQLPFNPTIDLDPTTTRADSSSGMDVSLEVPQSDSHNTLASAHLKRAVVTLPEGMALNPSAADGLEGCTEAQIGLISESPIRLDNQPANCPDGAKVGNGSIDTPLLPHPLDVDLYLADPDDNPFHSLLSGYLVAYSPRSGITIKLAAKFDRDPDTGQITATVDNNPQLPFSDLNLHFKSGPRGVLITPPTCGIYEIESKLVPWSAVDPNNPTPSEIVTRTSTFTVDSAPDGGPCQAGDPSQPGDQADRADRPFSPVMKAGVVSPNAGSSSPFVLRATRQDGEQEITSLNADLPPGLTAKLAGIPQCTEATINSIPTALGTGVAEKASPSCPAGSQLGTTQVGAGAGSELTYIPGNVYLAGPYQGAPLSLAIVTPAVTGPFDLGNVVIRTKLLIDQDDAQVHAVSDPLPTILEGIPLHIRDIQVTMDRPGFIQTPTNCSELAVTGSLGGGGGVLADASDDISAAVSDRFQVSGCGGLGFSPKLSGAILNGQDGIHRSDHPNLLFSLHGTPGDANLSRVEVLLPQNFQIDQANLGNICSETQLATQDCAGRQRIGTASATTPLLDTPLSGPVYAVSGSGGLPKLAVILYGPPSMPIKLVVRGITETVGARIKNTFPLVPDAPVSDFALNLDGGDKGYLVNNSDLCGSSSKGKKSKKKKGKGKRSIASAAKKKKGKKKSRSSATGIAADATFFGQNGDTLSQSVPISAECGAGGGGKKKGKGKNRSGKRR